LRVLVYGAGIAGLTAALELARAGARVEVADPRGPGAGATSRAAGIVTLQMPGALEEWAMEAIEAYTRLGAARRVHGVVVAPRPCVERLLSERLVASGLAGGLTASEASRLVGHEVRVPEGWGAAYTLDALVDVGGLVSALTARLEALGVSLGRRAPSPYEASLGGYDAVVVAAGAWTPAVLGVEPREIAGSSLYNCEASSVALPEGSRQEAILYVESGVDAAYSVPEAPGRAIVGDGPNNVIESPLDAAPTPGAVYQVLETLAEAAPAYLDAYPTASWAAPCLITGDGLPAVGEWVEGIYILAGLDGYGLMAAPALARLLAHNITRGTPLPGWLDPHRRASPWRGEGPPPEPFRGCS